MLNFSIKPLMKDVLKGFFSSTPLLTNNQKIKIIFISLRFITLVHLYKSSFIILLLNIIDYGNLQKVSRSFQRMFSSKFAGVVFIFKFLFHYSVKPREWQILNVWNLVTEIVNIALSFKIIC